MLDDTTGKRWQLEIALKMPGSQQVNSRCSRAGYWEDPVLRVQGMSTCVDAKGPCVFPPELLISFFQERLATEHRGSEVTRRMGKERKIGNRWEF